MQNVLIEKPYRICTANQGDVGHKHCIANLDWFKHPLRKLQGVVKITRFATCRFAAAIALPPATASCSLLTTRGHGRSDGHVLSSRSKTPCNFYAMASWHLFNQGWLTRTMIRLMGAFSVNREGLDRQAVDHAIEILQTAERPLVIFPEGTTSRTNDQVMSLMEGPAFIARTAAKRRSKHDGGKVVVHPVGLKYVFQGDLHAACDDVLTRIEEKLHWRPSSDLPLIDRLIKVGNGLLTLKELQYGITTHDGSHRQRQTAMVNRLLCPLEEEWLGKEQAEEGIAIRIKNLRMKIFPEMARNELAHDERKRRWKQLEDTYLAQQIDCYPENYVVDNPTADRILETVEKFEEDLTDHCTIHGNLKVIIDVCEPIEVSTQRVRGVSEDPLITAIRESLQTKLNELQHESARFDSD